MVWHIQGESLPYIYYFYYCVMCSIMCYYRHYFYYFNSPLEVGCPKETTSVKKTKKEAGVKNTICEHSDLAGVAVGFLAESKS